MQFRRCAAGMRENLCKAGGEAARAQGERIRQPGRVFVADEVLFIQREQSPHQELRDPSHAAHRVVNITSISRVRAQ